MSEHYCDDCESIGRPPYANPCATCGGGKNWTPRKKKPEKAESQWHSLLKDPTDLPVMHDAGILKRIGVNEKSKDCIVTLLFNDGTRLIDEKASLRDGEWYSDTGRWLIAGGMECKVIAWMYYPEPYKGD